jgi:hypothetical protein
MRRIEKTNTMFNINSHFSKTEPRFTIKNLHLHRKPQDDLNFNSLKWTDIENERNKKIDYHKSSYLVNICFIDIGIGPFQIIQSK